MSTPQTSLSQSCSHFHLFNKLPFELRRYVWKLCYPHRIIDIDWPPNEIALRTACLGVEKTSFRNSRLPIITRICRESRAVFFEREPDFDEESYKGWSRAAESKGFRAFVDDLVGFNPAIDIIHLNWNPYLECNDWWNVANPIPEFLAVAARSNGASITTDLIHNFHTVNERVPHYPAFREDDIESFTWLDSRKDYNVVVEMISLHVSMTNVLASGLFGRLGEERIVIVDATDEEIIQRYHKLWISGPQEDREPERFFNEILEPQSFYSKLEKWKYELGVYWLRFKCQQAIMNGTYRKEYLDKIWYTTEISTGFDKYPKAVPKFQKGPGANWNGLYDENHPFSKRVRNDMPRFSPVIMFRLCEEKCHEAKRRRFY